VPTAPGGRHASCAGLPGVSSAVAVAAVLAAALGAEPPVEPAVEARAAVGREVAGGADVDDA
jgi:hypothetical protein